VVLLLLHGGELCVQRGHLALVLPPLRRHRRGHRVRPTVTLVRRPAVGTGTGRGGGSGEGGAGNSELGRVSRRQGCRGVRVLSLQGRQAALVLRHHRRQRRRRVRDVLPPVLLLVRVISVLCRCRCLCFSVFPFLLLPRVTEQTQGLPANTKGSRM
jgi:hypothetical protein